MACLSTFVVNVAFIVTFFLEMPLYKVIAEVHVSIPAFCNLIIIKAWHYARIVRASNFKRSGFVCQYVSMLFSEIYFSFIQWRCLL